ncbi:MAG: hypothetical protein N3D79_06480, partial [Acidilobaceae archaeon]|nr:hypothetical protein [Acidilobaceae archaeon]
ATMAEEQQEVKEEVRRTRGSWDMGIDYESAYRRLAKIITKADGGVGICYASIALTQLRNGSRVSEAIDAFLYYVTTGAEVTRVKVRKKKKEEFRLMRIPPIVLQNNKVRETCRELTLVPPRKLRDRVRWWVRVNLNSNTHSLRYSFITHALMSGLDFAVVARAVHHSNPVLVQRYIQQRIANHIIVSDSFDPVT